MMPKRCDWVTQDDVYIEYHDGEWGVPVHEDRKLFEMLILEGAQAGLSWLTILKRRGAYRQAYQSFDYEAVAAFDAHAVQQLLQDPGIVRNRLKILSSINNAIRFLEVREAFGTFDSYVWQFVDGQPIVNNWKTQRDIPANTAESDALSRDLKRRGFNFVGSTICYAFMQSIGMVNDHTTDCFRHGPVSRLTRI